MCKGNLTVDETQYNTASLPTACDLLGVWTVTILSGSIPDMRRLGHVKVIKTAGDCLRGYNRTLGVKWGRFGVEFSTDCALFLYGKWRLFDRVRKHDDLLIGQIVFTNGKPEVGGYFQMRRKD